MSRSASASSHAYRTEIDGLRALAVLPVVLYHYGVSGFSGGFVGVDIFFVISGFLIGGLLWNELQTTGGIKLGAFFGRRIRRLAPAYVVVALTTLIAAWFVLMPFDFREFGQELTAATVYLANIHFFREAGYFDTASDQKLLLHTWSLAVEEQFYVFLPLFMIYLARIKSLLPMLLVAVFAVSLIACLWMMQSSPTAAFYLFPFRAWEMLAGVLLAIYGNKIGFAWRLHAALSWVGVALILIAVFTFEAGDHFPGAYAIVPVLGAFLIILNGKDDNVINRALSNPVLLFFGLISYSLYLWHWPMVTLLKYYLGVEALTAIQIGVLFVVSVTVSWLSLKLIETPIRRGGLSGWKLPIAYVVASGGLVATALSFAFSDGLPERFAPHARPYIAATRDFNQNWSRCHTPSDGPWQGLEICPIGPDGPPEILVWGDSHARAFKEGLDLAAHESQTPGLLIWRGGCPPLLGIWKNEMVSTPTEEADCAISGSRVETGLAGTRSIERVLLIGRWAYYAEGIGVGVDDHNWIRLSERQNEDGDNAVLFRQAMDQTVDRLGEISGDVFVLRQVPEAFAFTSQNVARELAYGRISLDDARKDITQTARQDIDARLAVANAAIDVAVPADRIIDLTDYFCTGDFCSALIDDLPVYFDNNHVTNTGAKMVRAGFDPIF